MTQPQLGARLRSLRLERSLSIAEVAEQTALSGSFLSMVETGKSDISIGRLMRLIDFYGVLLSDLFPERAPTEIEVIRHDEYVAIRSGKGMSYSILGTSAARSMVPFVAHYEPGAGMADAGTAPGDAFVFVLEGTLEVEFDEGTRVSLSAGDGLYVRNPHERRYWNEGPATARVLGILAPPS